MSRKFVSSLVQLSPNNRLALSVYLALDKKNTRQIQKLKTLQNYVQRYSSGWKKRLELADLLYEMGNWSDAIVEYTQVIQKRPHLLKPRMQLGKILQLINRTESAISTYQEAIPYAKEEATRQHLIGLIETCKHNTRDAIASFQSATALAPKNLNHWFTLGKLQMDMEYPAEALSSFETLLSIEPDDLMSLLYSHDLLLALGKISEAERRLDRAMELAPQDIQTLKRVIINRHRKRLVCDAAGKHTKKLLNAFFKQANSSPMAHSLLAQYYILRKEPHKGLQVMRDFVEEHVNNPHGWYYYSLYLFELGENDAATDAILDAYQLSEGKCDREIYRALCIILPTTGKLDQTHSIIQEMLRHWPKSWSLWSTAGRVLVEYLGENELGCNHSYQATQLHPQLADTWFYHGQVLSLAGEYQDAISSLSHGWQLLLPQASSLRTVAAAVCLGTSHYRLGHCQEGQDWLHIALQKAEDLIKFEPVKAQYWRDQALAELKNIDVYV